MSKPLMTDVERQATYGELLELPTDFSYARSAVELRKIVRRLRLVADTIEEATKRDA